MYLLIADDNPLTLVFLRDAVRQLGHSCAWVADGNAALHQACSERFDLLLLDLRMPGLGGMAVLQQLRASAAAASHHSRALATTADSDPTLPQTLHAAGFDGLLTKPLDIATLQRALGVAGVAERAGPYDVATSADPPMPAPDRAEPTAQLLDDALALRNLGNRDGVRALRRLFRAELDALPAEIQAALEQQDASQLSARLHKLCASAGFCGAPRLDQACRALRRHVDGGGAISATALRELLQAAEATRQALDVH
jgi:CheY-like chemotaxis protein